MDRILPIALVITFNVAILYWCGMILTEETTQLRERVVKLEVKIEKLEK